MWFALSTFGAVGKTRLDSSIQNCKPHLICRHVPDDSQRLAMELSVELACQVRAIPSEI